MKCKYQLFSQAVACAFAQVNVFAHYCKLVLLFNTMYSQALLALFALKQNIRYLTQPKKKSNN
jgi:hypothetical protein